MNGVKKFITIFFVVLGVIFFVLIIFGIYFHIADPLNLRPLLFGTGESNSSGSGNSGLSEEQKQALEKIGIDPASVPSEFTPEQEKCFEEKLGEERVAQIKAGDVPTPYEYYIARDCVE